MAQLKSLNVTGSFSLKSATSDTSSAGNLWFNTATNRLQFSAVTGWATVAPLIYGGFAIAAAGTSTAALAFGCRVGTQAFNGTSWSSGGSMITTREALAGGGASNTAALAFGGCYLDGFSGCACTEAYNGTSWSSGGDMNYGRYYLGGVGTPTAALAFGGYTQAFGNSANTEAYNGSSWSTAGYLISTATTGLFEIAAAGTPTAALAFGGQNGYQLGAAQATTQAYNGTSWSVVASLNQAKTALGGAGTSTSAIAFGGWNANTGVCCISEAYNGTSWSFSGVMINPRYYNAGAGSSSQSVVAIGGYNPTGFGCTETYCTAITTRTP